MRQLLLYFLLDHLLQWTINICLRRLNFDLLFYVVVVVILNFVRPIQCLANRTDTQYKCCIFENGLHLIIND